MNIYKAVDYKPYQKGEAQKIGHFFVHFMAGIYDIAIWRAISTTNIKKKLIFATQWGGVKSTEPNSWDNLLLSNDEYDMIFTNDIGDRFV